MFWTDNGGMSPELHARITRQQVLENIWKPKMDNMQVRTFYRINHTYVQ